MSHAGLQLVRPSEQPREVLPPLLQMEFPSEVTAVVDRWMEAGVEDRKEAIRLHSATQEFKQNVLLTCLARAKTASTGESFKALATAARDYAVASGLAKTHPLTCLANAYLAEGFRLCGQGSAARALALSSLRSLEDNQEVDPVVKAEVLLAVGKVLWEAGDGATADRLLSQAGLLFARIGDDRSRGQALVMAAWSGVASDPPFLAGEFLVEALFILLGEEGAKTVFEGLLVTLGHALCDRGRLLDAKDVTLVLERCNAPGSDPVNDLRETWLAAKVHEMSGNRLVAGRLYHDCRRRLQELYRGLNEVLDAGLVPSGARKPGQRERLVEEATLSRRQVMQAYHNLGILASWSEGLGRRLEAEGREEISKAVRFVAGVLAQQQQCGPKEAVGTCENHHLIDWDPEAELIEGNDLAGAVRALGEELAHQAEWLLSILSLAPEGWRPGALRTAAAVLNAAAVVTETSFHPTPCRTRTNP